MDLPSFPSLTSTWDFGQSNLTKKVNDSQQSSSPGASILTNALRWDYLSAQIYQEKMSAIFLDMEIIICFIDDIALITNGSFENHLNKLDEILQRLKENNLQVNGNKSSFCPIEAEFLGFVLT
jgi:hypothetical protein